MIYLYNNTLSYSYPTHKRHTPNPLIQEGETVKNRDKVVKFVFLFSCFYKWEGSKKSQTGVISV